MAHALRVIPGMLRGTGARLALRTVQVATVLALVALALPWAQDEIAPRAGVAAVPDYWSAAADYLAEEDDDGSVALELPASAFGVYDWGNVHDDVMQGLADSPWAVRNVIPLAPPGQRRLPRRGHPGRGVGAPERHARVVPRGQRGEPAGGPQRPRPVPDRDPRPGLRAERADPVAGDLAGAVVRSRGRLPPVQLQLRRAAPGWSAAPASRAAPARSTCTTSPPPRPPGSPPRRRCSSGTRRPGCGPGWTARSSACWPRTRRATSPVRCSPTVPAAGRPTSPRCAGTARAPWRRPTRGACTDPSTTTATSPTPSAGRPPRSGPAPSASVQASSSEAFADALPPLQIGAHPGAALDRRPRARPGAPRGRSTPPASGGRSAFTQPQDLGKVTVTLPRDSARVPKLAAPLRSGRRGSSTPPTPASPGPTSSGSPTCRCCASPRPGATCGCPARSGSPRCGCPDW